MLFGDKVKTDSLAKLRVGEKQVVGFTFPNILYAGRYLVDLSVYSENTREFCDCRIDCESITTHTRGVKGYPIVVESQFEE